MTLLPARVSASRLARGETRQKCGSRFQGLTLMGEEEAAVSGCGRSVDGGWGGLKARTPPAWLAAAVLASAAEPATRQVRLR